METWGLPIHPPSGNSIARALAHGSRLLVPPLPPRHAWPSQPLCLWLFAAGQDAILDSGG